MNYGENGRKNNPLTYAHEWLGEPDDAGSERKVLPYMLLSQCVEAWDRRPVRGVWGTGGFDVADTGADYNALALRVGPEWFHMERWHGSDEFTISHSSRKSGSMCVREGISRLDYDDGGVGRGVRGPLREWIKDNQAPLRANGVSMGGKVQGEDIIFERRRPRSVTNKQYFPQFWVSGGDGIGDTCSEHGTTPGRRWNRPRKVSLY